MRIGKRELLVIPQSWFWTQFTKPEQFVQPGDVVYVRVKQEKGGEAQAELEQDSGAQGAMMAVDNMLGDTHDIWNVNTDFEYHEEQRVDADAGDLATLPGPAAGTTRPAATTSPRRSRTSASSRCSRCCGSASAGSPSPVSGSSSATSP